MEFSLLLILLGTFLCYGQTQYSAKPECDSSGSSPKCFFVFQVSMNHLEAAQYCRSQSAQLLNRTIIMSYLLFLQRNFGCYLEKGIWADYNGPPSNYHYCNGTNQPTGGCFVLDIYWNRILEPVCWRQCFVLCYREYPDVILPEFATVPCNAQATDGTEEPSCRKQYNIPVIVAVVLPTIVVCAVVTTVAIVFACSKRKQVERSAIQTASSRANQYQGQEDESGYELPGQPAANNFETNPGYVSTP